MQRLYHMLLLLSFLLAAGAAGCSLPPAADISATATAAPAPPQRHVARRSTQAPSPTPRTMVVSAQALNVRRGPGIEYPAFAWLTAGQAVVSQDECSSGWCHIGLPGGGETGWVSQKWLEAP